MKLMNLLFFVIIIILASKLQCIKLYSFNKISINSSFNSKVSKVNERLILEEKEKSKKKIGKIESIKDRNEEALLQLEQKRMYEIEKSNVLSEIIF